MPAIYNIPFYIQGEPSDYPDYSMAIATTICQAITSGAEHLPWRCLHFSFCGTEFSVGFMLTVCDMSAEWDWADKPNMRFNPPSQFTLAVRCSNCAEWIPAGIWPAVSAYCSAVIITLAPHPLRSFHCQRHDVITGPNSICEQTWPPCNFAPWGSRRWQQVLWEGALGLIRAPQIPCLTPQISVKESPLWSLPLQFITNS